MYRNRKDRHQTELEFIEFHSPFSNKLRRDNRWVRLAELIPWDHFEFDYAEQFGKTGNPAIPFRVALGSLLIKERLQLTDEEVVLQVQENPYLQYFLGFPEYKDEKPFDASTLTYFRKRISSELLCKLNVHIHFGNQVDCQKDNNEKPSDDGSNQGKMIIDATCVPEDIHFPTDVSLLNKARELTERIIDELWVFHPNRRKKRKFRTYRKKARKQFLSYAKRLRPSRKHIRRALREQLQYVGRNLRTIEIMKVDVSLSNLAWWLYRRLLVIHELYRQQREHYNSVGTVLRSIPDRIVSIHKPHVRPIVRGKASAETEFGSKISISVISGKVFLDKISWDAYNEGGDLKTQSESFRQRTGHYPASIHADKIYRNRDNRTWCKEKGIRLSGPALGRRPSDKKLSASLKRLERDDGRIRNEVEGKIGISKRRYSLSRLLMKLKDTSEHAIALVMLVMNLEKLLRAFFAFKFCLIQRMNTMIQQLKIQFIEVSIAPKLLDVCPAFPE